ncbi:hypothetical protein COL516b_011201 [Colletotrichum fioriniae]|nr:uncharacterized protein COL516b_011201 [Colletotrichum fioriniae]KAJ0296818.1 hypothetical protein COL516b_011201 [Colletotrichum fioriniae]
MAEVETERILAVYLNAVRAIIHDPEAQISKICLTSALDEKQMQEWNSFPLKTNGRCIHDMISETVNRQPSRPAICAWDGDLSYAEVDFLSTNIASRLQALGVVPEDIVVLCFEKSLWAVVSMLAVAKSGAVFVHIDPNGAPKRNESVVEQTGARIGLSSPKQSDKLRSLVETLVIVDRTSIENIPNSGISLTHSVTPLNTLYVIFTSGTTGTPKGVVIQHKSFCSAVAYNSPWLQIEAESRVLQFTNFCFDASLEEIFTVLVAGGCICIPSEEERMSDIPGFVARKQVNWAAFTPSFLRTLDPGDLGSVKFITVHAEPMGQDLVARWAGKIHMRPSYGPTECSVTSTIGAPFKVDTIATNIGWPVGCRAWVVHPENHHMLMPVGAIGELLLDGPVVGKGYLNDEIKTATAFIEPPLWAADKYLSYEGDGGSRRLYKTGDLVRYAEDGSLLIQRRKDHSQVKIRGQRVELGEIQYHLNNLSGIIQHSMVLVPESGNLKGRLVAVVSLTVVLSNLETRNYNQDIVIIKKDSLSQEMHQKLADAMNTITSALERELPQYMMPESWLIVKTLPVQLSLKLDRQRVMSWVGQIDHRTLQDALDLHKGGSSDHRIGLEQSFFRIGGDSIYAPDNVETVSSCSPLAHVFSDFVTLYRGQSPGANPLTCFHDYIEHINSRRDLHTSNEYWVDKLQGVKPYMVPIETMVGSGSDPHTMGSVNFAVDITVELKQFLREAGVTLSNVLQFAWAMLLHVYTGHSTVCFGHLVSDRDIDLPHADEVIGPMLSMMIACATFDDSTMVMQALQAFQDENIRSLEHKTFDLTEVERQLGCESTGLFNTLVNYRKVKYSDDDLSIGFQSIWKQDPHEQLLVLAFNEGPSRLDATLTYYESLFSETTMKTLTQTYRRLLDLLIDHQSQTVGNIKAALAS